MVMGTWNQYPIAGGYMYLEPTVMSLQQWFSKCQGSKKNKDKFCGPVKKQAAFYLTHIRGGYHKN